MSAKEVKHQLIGGISEYIDCDSKQIISAAMLFGVFKYNGKAEQTTAFEFLNHLNR